MGYDFYQVQLCVLGRLHCLVYRDYAHLLSICTDESDFDYGDIIVQAVSFILFGDSKFPLSNILGMFAGQQHIASPGTCTDLGKPIIAFVPRRCADARRIQPGS